MWLLSWLAATPVRVVRAALKRASWWFSTAPGPVSYSEASTRQAGIGVAAGQVVAGDVGAKERFEYAVIGKPVNEAARRGYDQPTRLALGRHTDRPR